MSAPTSNSTGSWPVRRNRVRRMVRDALLRNFSIKVFSLVLAVVAWVMVQEERTEEEEVVARIVYVWPDDLILTSRPADSVRVRATGPRTALKGLTRRKLTYRIDLRDSRAGETSISLVGRPVQNLPRELQVVSVSPSSLRFVFDERVTKRLPIRATHRGEPAPGHWLRGMTAEPSEVTVEGAQGALADLTEVPTVPIALEGRKEPFTTEAELDLRGRRAWPQGAGKAQVQVDIQRAVNEHTVIGVPVRVPSDPEGLAVAPDRVSLIVKGAAGPPDARRLEDLEVRVVLPERPPSPAKEGWSAVARWGAEGTEPRLEVEPPDGVEVLRVEPDRVTVTRAR